MNCPVQNGTPELLLDYSARKLSSGETELLSRHIAACEDCSDIVAAQDELWATLDAWQAAPLSANFDEKLYARIEADGGRSFWSRLVGDHFTWKPAVSFAGAVATVAIAAFLVIPSGRVDKKAVTPQVSRDASAVELDAEQVERTLEDLEMLRQLSPGVGSQAL